MLKIKFIGSSDSSLNPTDDIRPVSESTDSVASEEPRACLANVGPSLPEDPCRVVVRLTPTRNLSVTTGSDVIVKCTATGKPRPQITWFRNDKPLEKAELLIRNKR